MNIIIFSLFPVLCYIADLIFGDPEWMPHPVRGIGKLISFLENRMRRKNSFWIERMKGAVLAIIVIGTTASLAYMLIKFSGKLSPLLGGIVYVYIGYTAISVKDLKAKAGMVLEKIKEGSIDESRRSLSKIVGRDTHDLSEDRITIAVVETVAENINDGIIAPVFYLILGGPVLAIAYKSINTLDSMIGYKNERYIHFGWFSAKLDDIANFIPARLSGFLIAVSSLILYGNFRNSFRTMLRDGRKHASPNSGVSEAAMAGALGVKLGGRRQYNGTVYEEPYIGEEKNIVCPSMINKAVAAGLTASVLIILTGTALRFLLFSFCGIQKAVLSWNI